MAELDGPYIDTANFAVIGRKCTRGCHQRVWYITVTSFLLLFAFLFCCTFAYKGHRSSSEESRYRYLVESDDRKDVHVSGTIRQKADHISVLEQILADSHSRALLPPQLHFATTSVSPPVTSNAIPAINVTINVNPVQQVDATTTHRAGGAPAPTTIKIVPTPIEADTNEDGKISYNEFVAFAKACVDDPNWVDSQYGNGTVNCDVLRVEKQYLCHGRGNFSIEARRACPMACGVCGEAAQLKTAAAEDTERDVSAKASPFTWCGFIHDVAGRLGAQGIDKGGLASSADLELCKAACKAHADCTGFDYAHDTSISGGYRCWLKSGGNAAGMKFHTDTESSWDFYVNSRAHGCKAYFQGGVGVAGPTEIWDVSTAKGQGVQSCYEAVMVDSRCSKDYFTYVARGDENCGCRTSVGALSIRSDANADYYRTMVPTTTTQVVTTTTVFTNEASSQVFTTTTMVTNETFFGVDANAVIIQKRFYWFYAAFAVVALTALGYCLVRVWRSSRERTHARRTLSWHSRGDHYAPRQIFRDYQELPVVDNEGVREKIRSFRMDPWSRMVDKYSRSIKNLRRCKAFVMSQPCVVRIVILTTRAAFIYSYASNVLVAKSCYEDGIRSWAMLILVTMALPYMILVAVLSKTAPRKISGSIGFPTGISSCLWLVLGMPSCLFADFVLTVWYLTSLPTDAQVFHYMTLRNLTELVEGSLQSLIQGYLLLRLSNPAHLFPEVAPLVSRVNPWLLGSSVAFSIHSVWDAYNTLASFAKYHSGGSKCKFIRHMSNLGEGLVPSNYFSELSSRRCVNIMLCGTVQEIKSLSTVASESDVLEELTIFNASCLEKDEDSHADMEKSLERFMAAARLKSFVLHGAKQPSAWMAKIVRQAAKYHRCLEKVELRGLGELIQSEKLKRIESISFLKAVSCEDHAAVARMCLLEPDIELLAEALSDAAAVDSQEIVRSLLLSTKGLDAVRRKTDVEMLRGCAPLHEASARNSERSVDLLLLAGSNVNGMDGKGETPLQKASGKGHLGIVTKLLQSRADINVANRDGLTSLTNASIGHPRVVAALLECRADVDTRNRECGTPTYVAAQEGHADVLNLLVCAKANVNIARKDGTTPFFVAAQKGSTEELNILVKAKADVDARRRDGATAFDIAIHSGHDSVVHRFIDAKIDVNRIDAKGARPISMAAFKGHVAIARLLMNAKADLDKVDSQGSTPIDMTVQNGHDSVLRLLISAKVDANRTNSLGCIPLFMGSVHGHTAIVEYLLQARASVNARENTGHTPLNGAAFIGHVAIVQKLIEFKADLEARNNQGQTPLAKGKGKGHEGVVNLLRRAGARY